MNGLERAMRSYFTPCRTAASTRWTLTTGRDGEADFLIPHSLSGSHRANQMHAWTVGALLEGSGSKMVPPPMSPLSFHTQVMHSPRERFGLCQAARQVSRSTDARSTSKILPFPKQRPWTTKGFALSPLVKQGEDTCPPRASGGWHDS